MLLNRIHTAIKYCAVFRAKTTPETHYKILHKTRHALNMVSFEEGGGRDREIEEREGEKCHHCVCLLLVFLFFMTGDDRAALCVCNLPSSFTPSTSLRNEVVCQIDSVWIK